MSLLSSFAAFWIRGARHCQKRLLRGILFVRRKFGSPQQVLELARCEYIARRQNVIAVGNG